MTTADEATLRLLFPRCQGGIEPSYRFGSRLLEWLAPEAGGPTEQVTVPAADGPPLEVEAGINARGALLVQAREARRLIDEHRPDRLVVFGGDCLVDLAPFAYLNERYDGRLAVLWVDAHSDLMPNDQFANANSLPLGCLLGEGDPDFVGQVRKPLDPRNVMFAGLRETPEPETVLIGPIMAAYAPSKSMLNSGRRLAPVPAPVGVRDRRRETCAARSVQAARRVLRLALWGRALVRGSPRPTRRRRTARR